MIRQSNTEPPVNCPKNRLPSYPVLTWSALWGKRAVASVLNAGPNEYLTSGRAAMALALKRMGIGPGDRVLLPAYHSTSMVAAVQWTGAESVYYRIQPNLSVDLADIERRIEPGTRVLVAVHYFGFAQPVAAIRALCQQHKLLFLEDCAHAFFGQIDSRPIGSFGDCAIASPMKFLPVFDGGCLISSRYPSLCSDRQARNTGFEIKAGCNILERSLIWNCLWPLNWLLGPPLRAKDRLWKLLKSRFRAPTVPSSPASEGGSGFDSIWVHRPMTLASQLVMHLTAKEGVIEVRRNRYQRLSKVSTELPGARPLFPDLPSGTVPYLFPLWLDRPERARKALRQLGIPILRFGETLPAGAINTCAVSAGLSRHLIQLPCHQTLRERDMDNLVRGLRKAFPTY